MEQPIIFDFEDATYQVSQDAYDSLTYIELPDGRILDPNGWLESMPPQPYDLTVIDKGEVVLTTKAEIYLD